MLDFDPDRFLRIQRGAVEQAGALQRVITGLLDRGCDNLVFAGSGGAGILMEPAAHLLATRSSFPGYVAQPAELVALDPAYVGANSIVVIPSLSGTTRESVEALAHCNERGATVITLTGHADTPLARDADVSLVNFAEDDTSCESFYVQSLAIVLAILQHRGEIGGLAGVADELPAVPEALLAAKTAFEDRAERIARLIQHDDYHIITGAGSTWPQAHYYGMCILEEMQWIRTRPVHAAHFFHGTLELVEPGVDVLLFKGEDETRLLVDRVEKFVAEYTDRYIVLDAAEFELPGLSAETRAVLSPAVLATVLERVSTHLAALRDHPLTTRRYYKRVSY